MKTALSIAVALFSACAVSAGDIVTISQLVPAGGCMGAQGDRVKIVPCSDPNTKWYVFSGDDKIRLNSDRSKCLQSGYGEILQDGTQARVLSCSTSSLRNSLQVYQIEDDIRLQAFPDYAVVIQGNPNMLGNNVITKLKQNVGSDEYSWDFKDPVRRNLRGEEKSGGGWKLTYYEE